MTWRKLAAFCDRIKSHVKSVANRPRQCPISPTGIVSCQGPPHIRLGNPELPSNPCWRDARLECRTDCIHLSSRQGDFSDFHPASSGNLISWGQPFCDSRLRRFAATLSGPLPRRFISSNVAARSESNSSSFKYLTASCKLLGKTYRRETDPVSRLYGRRFW